MALDAFFYRGVATALSPAGSRARLSILIYHRILPQRDPLMPYEHTAADFDAELGYLKQVFNVLPLGEAVARLRRGNLPARAACITFDDGYANNATHALPLLRKHGLPACFFIATAYLNGGRMFNDTVIEAIRRARDERIDLRWLDLENYDAGSAEAKSRILQRLLPKIRALPLAERADKVAELVERVTDLPLPGDLMMTDAQVRAVRDAGMEIGGHTHRHPILSTLDEAAARDEIVEGADYLARILGERVRLFAYPNGRPGIDYRPAQVDMVKSLGFEAAVSTHRGAAHAHSDLFQLPRFTPWSVNRLRFQGLMCYNLATSYRVGRVAEA